ncbi:hypothetical protein CTAYLR_010186 [Chrysophaeum taylorii]|uniref:Mitochondrial glycoprotein n=1 Tax=Chrysophaeum taylorii TaxID=2483200 RepID=A0AAD7XHP3_9STRA|nr:hypothetical protein CTAYLR_010186 [Chrysophaeum taylorii]
MSALLRVARCVRPACGAVRARGLSSSQSALPSILAEEIDGEKANLAVDEKLNAAIAELQARGGSIAHDKGSGRVQVTLSKGVVAQFDCRDVATEEDESNEGSIEFDVKVTNDAGDRLIFECLAGDAVQIDGVAFYKSAAADDDKDIYDGPKFDELDPRVQAAFYSYLDERGVDPDLCGFINSYANHKEVVEYVNWLENVQAFVTK